ncbi:TetR/AcrR family transcriptional regulator [Microbacterium azadirachtae]|uniref:DNA-binding transcriptional regulator, AcrR family n=1 Tax=Microbacterium azadirachtae TaxID=582680 RepID=A0A1I6I744_9MICO|nr:TetR/AcrR family transcriptional regulator [Microbacterium azadirachtae]SFR62511.1 DNA-binding transcriptional regulator, AcrR family [Microbacterium azadirachtae]
MAKRGAYAKGVVKREEILEAALEIVGRRGYRNASVREIADAVGLSPAGLLHYFGTKEQLFVEILRARDRRDTAADDELEFFDAFLAIVRHNPEVPGLVQLYTQLQAEVADAEHPARAYFLDRTEQVHAAARAAIAAGQREGRIRADLDPEWIIRAGHALADGLQNAWMLDPTIDMAADVEQFFALLKP